MAGKCILCNVILILSLVLSIRGKPNCRRQFVTEVTCTAGNEDYILRRGLVSDNNNTFVIKLQDCRITEVHVEAFKNNYNLLEIDLSCNKIKFLKKGVFDGITKLRHLNLSQNLLTKLPLGIFDNLPSLRHLEITDNKIILWEVNLFDHVPNLVNLSMSGNDFVGMDLDPSFFKGIPNLGLLKLSGNDMSQSPENLLQFLRKLKVLELNDCSLTEVPKFATSSNLYTMQRLYLQKNSITTIDVPSTFANLENLVVLDLFDNVIYDIHSDAFNPLTKLTFLDLSFNKLKRIPTQLFRDMIRLQSIDLSYNFIESIPISAFYGTRLKTLRLNGNRISFLDSNFCEILQRSSHRLSTFLFQDNHFLCPCLLEILNEVKKFGIGYNTDKFNGEQPVCFMTDDFNCTRQS